MKTSKAKNNNIMSKIGFILLIMAVAIISRYFGQLYFQDDTSAEAPVSIGEETSENYNSVVVPSEESTVETNTTENSVENPEVSDTLSNTSDVVVVSEPDATVIESVSPQEETTNDIADKEPVEQSPVTRPSTTINAPEVSKNTSVRKPKLPKGATYKVDKNDNLTTEISFDVNGIVFIAEKGTNSDKVQEIYADLKAFPVEFCSNIKVVTVVPNDLAIRFGFPDSYIDTIGGMCNGTSVYLHDSKYSSYIGIHEYFHAQDYAYGEGDLWLSDSKEWQKIYKEGKKNGFEDAENKYLVFDDEYEYFASCAQVWYMNPAYAKKYMPTAYDYFQEVFGDDCKSPIDYSKDMKYLPKR